MSATLLIALVVLLALQVDTQLTVDDDDTGSCESSTSNDVISVIRDVRLIREDLKDVKTALTPNHQQQSTDSDTSSLSESLVVCLNFLLSYYKF